MAKANERPVLDLQAGVAALEEDIPRVLELKGVTSLEELGWSRPSKASLLVPMTGTFDGNADRFLLRLAFQAYRTWPPSAQFVNPETLAYRYPEDQQHVPKLTSGECQTHVAYQENPSSAKIQLICCSATQEFYDVLHGVEEQHIWSDTNTFLTTIVAIQRALASSYQGRFSSDGQ
jgi:hypothetical protein